MEEGVDPEKLGYTAHQYDVKSDGKLAGVNCACANAANA